MLNFQMEQKSYKMLGTIHYFCQDWFNLVQGFVRKKMKCEKIKDDRQERTKNDENTSHVPLNLVS